MHLLPGEHTVRNLRRTLHAGGLQGKITEKLTAVKVAFDQLLYEAFSVRMLVIIQDMDLQGG